MSVELADGDRDTDGVVTFTWLRQAGFLVEGATDSIVFDPFLTELPGMLVTPAVAPEDLGRTSVVMGSHEHADHIDGPAFARIAAASERPRFVVPAPVVDLTIAEGVPPDRVIGARPGQVIEVGSVRIHPVPARHGIHVSDAYDFGQDLSGGAFRYLGYVAELDGVHIYHAGDTIAYDGMVERLRALRVDVALLPINGRDHFREAQDVVGNLTPREAADLAAAIGTDLVVPMHYETVPGNTEAPGVFVDYLRSTHPAISTCLPGRGASFRYGRTAGR
jgi:L-ascorbate metabolism protein UlaG (beta-lactamase superfamily)